ncbi:hypothetical protein Hte_002806 [Hypoxylon texense]
MACQYRPSALGKDVPDKAIPTGPGMERLPDAVVGSWRVHNNAIQEAVRRNLSSALIMEDDADWDVRLRGQLYDFALASHALTQPLAGSSDASPRYADASFPDPTIRLSTGPDLAFDQLPTTVAPVESPYGDHWNVLWLGHCGMRFSFPSADGGGDNKPTIAVPKGRVQQQHLWTISDPDDLKAQSGSSNNHTRVAYHVQDGVCSLAYAVTRQGARKLLHELGLKAMGAAFDIELRWFCEGGPETCRAVVAGSTGIPPLLFGIHLPAGPKKSNSDISDHGDGYQDAATRGIRYNVRMNAEALMEEKRTDELVDQWPDADAYVTCRNMPTK